MRPDLDPDQLTPDERRQELAELLARGITRLRDRAALLTSPPTSATQNLPDSEPIRDSGVALAPESWLHVTTG